MVKILSHQVIMLQLLTATCINTDNDVFGDTQVLSAIFQPVNLYFSDGMLNKC